MALSKTLSVNYGVILSSAMLLLFLNVGCLTVATSVHRPSTCTICTDADRAKCPVIVPGPDCEEVNEPNCGCCKMCAKKVGEKCGVATGYCETGLECIPPPMTAEEYEAYGPADYFLEAALGEFICVSRSDFCKLLSEIYDDSNSIDDESLYIPVTCPPTEITAFPDPSTSRTTHTTDHTSTTDVIVPEIELVNPPTTTPRPANPPVSPFTNALQPCLLHADKVWSKERFDRHEWIPSCEDDGTYLPEQCELSFGLERGRCWCVDRIGIPVTKFIPGEESHPDICISHTVET